MLSAFSQNLTSHEEAFETTAAVKVELKGTEFDGALLGENFKLQIVRFSSFSRLT